jgi:TonB family protein
MRAGDEGRVQDAEKDYRKALKLAESPREKAIATTHLGIAIYSLNFKHGPKAAELAGPMFQEAIRLFEEASDTESADFALALEAWAVTCDARGMNSDAKNSRSRAGGIRQKLLAPGDAKLAAPAGKTAPGSGSAPQHDASEPHVEQVTPPLNPQAPDAQAKPARPVIAAPVPISKPEPEYDEQARRMRISGTVLLRIVVDIDGKAKRIGVLRILGFGLDEQAVRCVATWRFKPGTKDGAPVPVRANVEVNFRLL